VPDKLPSTRSVLFSWSKEGLTSSDCRNDADLVAFLYRSGFFLEEADVLVVDEDIYEAANIAALVTDALEETGVAGVEVCEDFADVRAGGGDEFLLIGELAEGGWDADLDGHGEKF
jgi:hypothetical protein